MRILCLKARAFASLPALLSLAALPAVSMPVHNVPEGLAIAHYEGRVDAAQEMNLTVALKMHNQTGYEKAVDALYDPASPTYHQWFTDDDFEKYAPTPAEYETVRSALVSQGFAVVSTDPLRFTIRVHGTAATVEKAFQTELDKFSYNGKTFQAHTRDAHLAGPADGLIDGVAGLERHEARPHLSILRNPVTGEPLTKKLLGSKADAIKWEESFTNAPLSASATISLSTFGGKPTAAYMGYEYGADGQVGGLTPAQLQAHYGMPFTQGSTRYDGTGQTIALVEAYGYATAEADANAAASYFKLPALNSSNFSIIYPDGKPLNPEAGVLEGWNGEIALDIQSAHAMAPGAKIVMVVSPAQDDEDMLNTLSYVISHKLANTVSNSWGEDIEALSGPGEENAFNAVLRLGPAAGISFQFSTGDSGDYGFGTPVESLGVPSNSPYVTAVGGTSILNDPTDSSNTIVTGWGSDYVYLYEEGEVLDPTEGEFYWGAGGGQSRVYAKPTWQKTLPGDWRMVPDIAALADPATGFPIVITESGKQEGFVAGGTSLASPLVTAIWAIADEYEGKALGQAAQYLSKLSTEQVGDVAPLNDVVPPTAAEQTGDVIGQIVPSKGSPQSFTRRTLFTDAANLEGTGNLSLYSQGPFLSAIWPFSDYGYDLVVSFGTDTSLTVTEGWDDVTGWGEPNGVAFVEAVTGKTTGAGEKKE
jgi:subtilase family serine protease